MNRYRVVRNVLSKQEEVTVEADFYQSKTHEGKIKTEFYSYCKIDEVHDPVATFWGEDVVVVKLPE